VLGIPHPRVALLNIGSEEGKGSQLAQEAYALMKVGLNGFAGNAEGTDIFAGRFDVIVTDGFTGNVVLKTLEGTAEALFGQVKAVLTSSVKGKVAAALVQKDLGALKGTMSADTTGGAPLLGLRSACIIGHGSSNEKAIANGIHVAARAHRTGLAATIAHEVEG
jgi:glycerol-3-phosphate acyltransferase PlsX